MRRTMLKRIPSKRLCASFLAFLLFAANASLVEAQSLGTAFTYQGRLVIDGNPNYSGPVPMVFDLYDASSGGTLEGTVSKIDIEPTDTRIVVVNGLFTVDLDFGGTPTYSEKYWLEITVDETVLGRQEVTPAPYAMFAKKSGDNLDNVVENGDETTLSIIVGGLATTGETPVSGAIKSSGNISSSGGSVNAGTTMTAGTSISAGTTVTAAGNITSSGGNVSATSGNVSAGTTVTAGTSMSAGTTVTAAGNITSSGGNVSATSGSVSAGTTVTAGTSMSAGTTMTAGGNITSSGGNVSATSGSVSAGTTVTAAGNITSSSGNISATSGNLSAGGGVSAATATIGTNKFVVTSGGKVGVGTSSPSTNHSMEIAATSGAPVAALKVGAGGVLSGRYSIVESSTEYAPSFFELLGGAYYNGSTWTATSTDIARISCYRGDITLQTRPSTSSSSTYNLSDASLVKLTKNGLVGIGVGSPESTLHVSDDDTSQLWIGDPDSSSRVGTLTVTEANGSDGTSVILGTNVYYNGSGYYAKDTGKPFWLMSMSTGASGVDEGIIFAQKPSGGSLAFKLRLSEKGELFFFDDSATPSTSSPSGIAKIYCEGNYLYATDSEGTANKISSHTDPRTIDPNAITSFADSNSDSLPYSIHHENPIIGKGSVIDVVKGLEYLEDMMQQSLGQEGGRLFFNYDLPPEKKISVEDFIANVVDKKIEQWQLQDNWIVVASGAGTQIPNEAVETREVYELHQVEETYTEDVLDLGSQMIVQEQKTRIVPQMVATGRFEKQLKENYKFQNGQLLRKATLEDMELTPADITELSDWILDRAPASSTSTQQIIQQQLSMGIQRAHERDRETARLSKDKIIPSDQPRETSYLINK